MKFLSLFSGVGGFELGVQYAYDAVRYRSKSTGRNTDYGDRSDSLDEPKYEAVPVPRCIGFSEIDRYALAIYRRHFPDHEAYGDISAIDPGTLPDFDLMCGGFPCQPFSSTGKRRGFEDSRGALFFEICRLAEAKRPRLLLLENVKGLLSHDCGRTFHAIISALDELGYDCQWQLLNGADWVPQNRERVVIVGHLRGTTRPQVFPLRRDDSTNTEVLRTGRPEQISPTIRATYHKTGNTDAYLTEGTRLRRLTPLECERLMGLPDGWTEYGMNERGRATAISDTQRYKVCGNGIIPQMVRDVAIALLEAA